MPQTEIKLMKALSIAQPWAECIVSKGKNVENRSWSTKQRGFVAIHASASYSKARFDYCYEDYRIRLKRDDLPFGVIVGFAEIVDVITENELTSRTKKWFGGEYGFVLKNVIKLKEPIPAKGSLGFWKLKGNTLKKCLGQLTSVQRKTIYKSISEQ